MTHDDYDERFGGLRRLYGEQLYPWLAQLHIAVVGLGGVGSWAVEALARTGVGTLTLIDYDTVAASNINRQLPALNDTLGEKKSTVMARRIRDINPDCQVDVIDDFINSDNLRDYLSPEKNYDYVIDAIDSIKFKTEMIAHCRRNKLPIITTGGAGGVTDPNLIHVADLSKTYNDALAAKVRNNLRSRFGFSKNPRRGFGVECVFSSQHKLYPKEDGSVSHQKPGIHGVNLDCRFGYGSAVFVTATFGMIAASRAINKALHKRQRKAQETGHD
ncbi:tRNA cyclic N6-threonylcarbamoyladenosine(37) synthase TcdA [Thiohalophilus thiocyanatoxydans]|uniref:tRNA A37 threonylcarbamoyladenosine dehydratase n=1 Tax=Thiohalophilus thiocyanatoxydans TaxID=381308 RepID=A0A4R8IPR4_9GAMM|nr:tRNA cyclic N6-threonylcarbamoyladenosine(37) synthase TcdA [Thiohalophilus thiocyanatoxydans]TDY02932.1 tRNA A37 threonylcarbamoyladenosine dehydratase [Thiohalophilus thiocyanatoxydans]